MSNRKFILKEISSNIYHVKFEKQITLTSTFLRFLEHYESPKFKNKVFTLKDYKKWYSKRHGNKFSYYWDWEGFNLPSTVMEPFYAGEFDPLTRNEKALLDAFRHLRGQQFCVVGTYGEDNGSVLTHEIAHALWCVDPVYKKKALSALEGLPKKADRKLETMLKKAGYHQSVWADEKHAYLSANAFYLQEYGVKGPKVDSVRDRLKFLYNLHLYLRERHKIAS